MAALCAAFSDCLYLGKREESPDNFWRFVLESFIPGFILLQKCRTCTCCHFIKCSIYVVCEVLYEAVHVSEGGDLFWSLWNLF